MIRPETLAALRKNATLGNEAEVAAFDAAIEEIDDLDQADIAELLRVFRDDAGAPEVMFGLVHRIEATPLGMEEGAVAGSIVELSREAPWWAQVLITRLVNSDGPRQALVQAARAGNAEALAMLVQVLEGIVAEDDQASTSTRLAIASLVA